MNKKIARTLIIGILLVFTVLPTSIVYIQLYKDRPIKKDYTHRPAKFIEPIPPFTNQQPLPVLFEFDPFSANSKTAIDDSF